MRANSSGCEDFTGSHLGACWCWAMDKTKARVDVWELKYLEPSLSMAVVWSQH